MVAPKKKISAAVTLLFMAPFVAEYLLGDLPLKLLPVMLLMAPMYGGGAILIREVTRRMGRGWPTMLGLGLAYMLIEEGLVTQSLFNHDYLKMHMHLLDPAYLPALGIGAWWTLLMVNLHVFWSMGVSIALVEALYPAEADAPWMGFIGDSVVGVFFVLGTLANFGIGLKQNQFEASHAQVGSVVALFLLVVAGTLVMPRGHAERPAGTVPSPWITGLGALLLGLGVTLAPSRWGWGAVSVMVLLDVAFLTGVWMLSRRVGWGALHTLSLAAGGAMAYGVHSFTERPLVAGALLWARISNAVFVLIAVVIVAVAARKSLTFDGGESGGYP